jgi:uncharacterized protein (DUF1778 family)
MSARTERVEARLAAGERERIRLAADLTHTSMSSFLVAAAVEKADEVLASHRVTTVPTDYFERLLASLDDDRMIPELERAMKVTRDERAFSRR